MVVSASSREDKQQDLASEAKDKVGSEPSAASNAKKQAKTRHRASVACASCRDRRIRCVVPAGDNECTQCKRSGVECVIKNDDERRRPISRAYMCSLTERIDMLESMLRDKGDSPPAATHPPMTRHGPRPDEPSPTEKYTSKGKSHMSNGGMNGMHNDSHSSPGSQNDEMMFDRDGSSSLRGDDNDSSHSAPSPSIIPAPKKDGMVNRLLSTRGHLSFDQLSGRLRYFGPTTNCHVHSEFGTQQGESQDLLEQSRRAEKVIRQLSMETYDYLMTLFWEHYNTYLHVIHQEAFNEDREHGKNQYYSPFLHIVVLAMGFRFADKSRPDMQKITVAPRESSLHREAKYMLEWELERPASLPSVIALLIMGDLECGVGRDNIGWLYGGMAVRLAFDIGLHLDTGSSGLPEREVDIRRMTLWACVVFDKYWALFLGRPTSMKSADLEVYSLSSRFQRLGALKPTGEDRPIETEIYEALLDLMELAGKITENMDSRSISSSSPIDRDAYLRMAALDREFGTWLARLPDSLKWTPENIRTAPLAFFLLHQQYHTSLILLHRPFAMYEDPSTGDEDNNTSSDNHFSTLSRAVCTKQAIRVAKIFWHHRQRFDTRQIPVTGLQHAGTAATALVAALAFIKDGNERNNNMSYLECLSASLQDMSYTYQPAERMYIVLQAVLAELRGNPMNPPTSRLDFAHAHRTGSFSNTFRSGTIPARRDSSSLDESMADAAFPNFSTHGGLKRRAIARPHSINGGTMDLHIDPILASMSNMRNNLRKASNTSDVERPDGFVLVTPRSEYGSSWAMGGTETSIAPSSTLTDNTSTAGGNHASSSGNAASHWMLGGTGDLDTQDVSHLATVHFPELRDLPTIGENGSPAAVPNLDFLSFAGAEEWREWPGDGLDSGFSGLPETPGSVRMTAF